MIMCGAGCHGAAEELRALSDRLKAPLIHSVKGKDIMPYDDPRWMGGIGMIGTKAGVQRGHALRPAADGRHRLSLFGISAAKGAVIQIDERPQVLGRRAPTALGVVGSVRPTLKLAARRGRGQERHQLLGPGDQGAPQMG